jgi:hypothetical protein
MRKIGYQIILSCVILLIVGQLFVAPVAASETLTVEFFWSSTCRSCIEKHAMVSEVLASNASYKDILVIEWKDIADGGVNQTEWDTRFRRPTGISLTVMVIGNMTNETVLENKAITSENITATIAAYTAHMTPQDRINNGTIDLWIFGTYHVSDFSLPILTIVLAVADSFNVCSMFILFILLSLLVNVQSRRRMLLIGSIFVFFSALWYLVFMFMLSTLLSFVQVRILSVVIGIVALIVAVINIKDFFFVKKGVSLSIPEERKPGFYKQMRGIVKSPFLFTAILGTIILAMTVNFFELICSFGFPMLYLGVLSSAQLPVLTTYLYIFSYIIIYIIPLIIIVFLCAFVLGGMKITESQGQALKLFSGLMLGCFGILFLIDHTILENIVVPLLILGSSCVMTVICRIVWKRHTINREK